MIRKLGPRLARAPWSPAEQCDELAAVHSITSSARASRVIGISRSIASFSARSNEPLLSPGEYDRHRACILDHLACGSEQPRCSVYSKCDNGVAQLVGRVEKVPHWIQTNEAWNAALRGLPPNRGKQSVCRIGSVHSHAVVATIGAIEPTSCVGSCW